jgi:hypothetical protein
MINEFGSKKYQANKLDNNFGTEGVRKNAEFWFVFVCFWSAMVVLDCSGIVLGNFVRDISRSLGN